MVVLAVTGGKGGVGKSTIAVGLAAELSKHGRVLLVDADVECPNDHILLGSELADDDRIVEVEIPKPVILEDKCIKCGICVTTCRESALFQLPGKPPTLLPDLCTGCGACRLACPVDAIQEKPETIGWVYRKVYSPKLTLLTGMLVPGYEEASPIVNKLMDVMTSYQKEYDYIIVDTSPGTHCNVLSVLRRVDLAIAVTEPTPLGAHDLDLILGLGKQLGLDMYVFINRFGVGDPGVIEEIAEKHDVSVIGRLPYSREVFDQYVKGIPVQHPEITKVAGWIMEVKS